MTVDEFRVHHRAASESLMRAAMTPVSADCDDSVKRATYFEGEAMKHAGTPRKLALARALLIGIDLVRAAGEIEFTADG